MRGGFSRQHLDVAAKGPCGERQQAVVSLKVAGGIHCAAGCSMHWLTVTVHRPNGKGQVVRAAVVVT